MGPLNPNIKNSMAVKIWKSPICFHKKKQAFIHIFFENLTRETLEYIYEHNGLSDAETPHRLLEYFGEEQVITASMVLSFPLNIVR